MDLHGFRGLYVPRLGGLLETCLSTVNVNMSYCRFNRFNNTYPSTVCIGRGICRGWTWLQLGVLPDCAQSREDLELLDDSDKVLKTKGSGLRINSIFLLNVDFLST